MPKEREPSKTKGNIWCFKLTFIGKSFKFAENKLQKFAKQFCKEGTNFKSLFSIFKLGSFFN